MYRILKLKDTQAGVLTLVFKISDAGVFAGWVFFEIEAIGAGSPILRTPPQGCEE